MKRIIFAAGFAVLAIMLPLSSCIDGDGTTLFSSSFNYSLQGTWETSPGSYYNTIVEIGYRTIKITSTTIARPQPLAAFTPNSMLKGYSEETTDTYNQKHGLIYIQDKGSWQDPIQYRYWVTEYPQSEKRLTLLISSTSDLTLFYKEP